MAPSHKRKTPALDDDFIHTISDNEPDILEEETELVPPSKKAKTSAAAVSKKDKKKNKKDKKGKNKKSAAAQDGDDDEEGVEEEEPSGLWGANDADDGAMDSDFEFGVDGGVGGLDGDAGFEGWGFEGAKKAVVGGGEQKNGVDLDEIIRRRRERKGETVKEEEVVEKDGEEVEVDLDDEVLADDGFGMGVGSDVEEDEEMGGVDGSEDEEEEPEAEDGDDDDAAASDNDSVATPVDHPDDNDSEDDEEDAEEEARRRDFFAAPEEMEQPKKGDLSSFQGMSLSRPILRGLTSVGFTKPTPIQAKTIPIALMGKDVVGGAVTGSGKTAAFVVPILERLLYRPKKVPTTRVVILTPTRELAIQCHSVATKLASHTDIKFCLAVGGLSLKVQEGELRLRPDVVIATPGRFIDHMRNSASFAVETVEILVLDEADRMLEDGFADELNEILTTIPKSRQTMLFSATMTSTVDKLIRIGLNKPARIMVDSQKKTAVTLAQEFVRLRPGREDKRMGYLVHICKTLYTERVIIFFRQKKIAHHTRIVFGLLGLSCAELHGSMNQAQVSSLSPVRRPMLTNAAYRQRRGVQGRQGQLPARDRSRVAWSGHQGRRHSHQLRGAADGRDLRAPRGPHGACRAQRCRHHAGGRAGPQGGQGGGAGGQGTGRQDHQPGGRPGGRGQVAGAGGRDGRGDRRDPARGEGGEAARAGRDAGQEGREHDQARGGDQRAAEAHVVRDGEGQEGGQGGRAHRAQRHPRGHEEEGRGKAQQQGQEEA